MRPVAAAGPIRDGPVARDHVHERCLDVAPQNKIASVGVVLPDRFGAEAIEQKVDVTLANLPWRQAAWHPVPTGLGLQQTVLTGCNPPMRSRYRCTVVCIFSILVSVLANYPI